MAYSKEFLAFLYDSFSSARISLECSSQGPFQDQFRSTLCEVADKYFLDIMPHANVNEFNNYSFFGDGMAKLFAGDLEASKKLITRFAKDPNILLSLLVKCPEESIRKNSAAAILGAFLKVASSEQDIFDKIETVKEMGKDNKEKISQIPTAISRQMLDIFIGSIGYDLATQWTKFQQFFETLKGMVISGGPAIIRYCLSRDLITILLDFFLEKNSPVSQPNIKRYEMGNQAAEPQFAYLMELVTFLIQQITSSENIGKPGEIYKLTPEALKCIQADDLIQKHLKCGGKMDQIGKLILHMCKDNKKYSKKVCKLMLRVINDYEVSKISQHIELLGDLITLTDSFQSYRFEWILGYQQPFSRIDYGLSTAFNIGDDINAYMSPLGIELRDDPLFQQLWRHRNRNEQFTVQCIKVILKLATVCSAFYKFMINTPSPTYMFGNYFEWIPKFIAKFSKPSTSGSLSDQKDKEVLLAETTTLVNGLQKKIKEENAPYPQLYMIGKTLKTREIKEREIECHGVKLVFTEIETEIYPSNPTGDDNTAVDGNYLTR